MRIWNGESMSSPSSCAPPAVVDSRDANNVTSSSPCDGGRSIVSFKYVEFYSGIGGWRLALEQAFGQLAKNHTSIKNDPLALKLECIAALDHSDLCNQVYQHNFDLEDKNETNGDTAAAPTLSRNEERSRKKQKRWKQRSKRIRTPCKIESLTCEQMEQSEWRADAWCMSPPCQPHTRQHDHQASERDDPRSKSLAHLCTLLSTMSSHALPTIIALENVVKFETSHSCQTLLTILKNRQYRVAEFHLTPTQVGLPNDRPRYFCLAIRVSIDQIDSLDGSDLRNESRPIFNPLHRTEQAQQLLDKYFSSDFTSTTEMPWTLNQRKLHTSVVEVGILPEQEAPEPPPIQDFLDPSSTHTNRGISEDLQIPSKVLDRTAAWCFDIVTPTCRRSSCFTSSYGKFVRGTGSILYLPRIGTDNNNNKAKQEIAPDARPSLCGKGDVLSSCSAHAGPPRLVAPHERVFDNNEWLSHLEAPDQELRYFTGIELARLFGFLDPRMETVDFKDSSCDQDSSMSTTAPSVSPHFTFPSTCTMKQQWKLMGNSLNARLASRLLRFGLLALSIAVDETLSPLEPTEGEAGEDS